MHVDVVQALRNVTDPSFLVLDGGRNQVDTVSRAGFGFHEDFKVSIASVDRFRNAERAATR